MKKVIIGLVAALVLFGGGMTALALTTLGDGKNRKLFADSLFALVTKMWPTLPLSSRVLIVAHAAYESGWGKTSNNRGITNNIFNITAGSSWKGPTAPGSDTNAAGAPIAQTWRAYPSLNAALSDYWAFLGRLYTTAQGVLLNGGTVASFVAGLKRGNIGSYFEANENAYTSSLTSIRNEVASYLGINASFGDVR